MNHVIAMLVACSRNLRDGLLRALRHEKPLLAHGAMGRLEDRGEVFALAFQDFRGELELPRHQPDFMVASLVRFFSQAAGRDLELRACATPTPADRASTSASSAARSTSVRVAERCGFANARNLVRSFRRWTGETPSAWRARGEPSRLIGAQVAPRSATRPSMGLARVDAGAPDRARRSVTARGVHDRGACAMDDPVSAPRQPRGIATLVGGRLDSNHDLSFTNQTAFSPTDTMPLARWAKGLMAVQATLSLVIAALIISRAVNGMAG